MSIDRATHGQGAYVMDSHHPARDVGTPCDECGFRPGTLTPLDAVTALRSFPRRYRMLVVPALKEDDGFELLRHRAPHDWSALEYTAHVRDVLHALEKRLTRIAIEDDPALGALDLDVPPSGVHEQGPEIVLATFLTNSEGISRTASSITGKDWDRSGHIDGHRIRALDLLMEAVHEGSHHLRDLERVLAEARRRQRG